MVTHVAIITTQGPVFVQELTAEDADVSPTVCLDGTTKQLPLTQAYADFVRKGSGLVEKAFGHAAWRMDLSDTIDTGTSWQLAVYLAHAVHAAGQLGNGNIAPGDHVLLATGAVKYSGDVNAVDHIGEKFAALAGHLSDWHKLGASVSILMHPDNLVEWQALALDAGAEPGVVEVRALTSVGEFTQPKLDTAEAIHPPEPPPGADKRGNHTDAPRHVGLVAVGVVVLILLALVPGYLSDEDSDNNKVMDDFNAIVDEPTPSLDDFPGIEPAAALTEPPQPTLVAVLQDLNGRCDGDDLVERELVAEARLFAPLALTNLCALRLQADEPAGGVYLYSLDSGALRQLTADQDNTWLIPFPNQLVQDRPYLLLLFAEHPDIIDESRLESVLDENRVFFSGNPTREAASLMSDINLTAETYMHTLLRD